MKLLPQLFKLKAIQSLKGNWQTALLVAFFANILVTVESLYQTVRFPNPLAFITQSGAVHADAYVAKLLAIPQGTWTLMGVLSVLALIITPALHLGCNHYFLSRLKGEDPGFAGLFSRISILGKALWLSIVTGIKVFLWSLLLVVPGIIAAIRYSMAPYFLAENPSLTVREAIQKSKQVMQDSKLSYFFLTFSFFGWMLLSYFLQILLGSVNTILSLVVGQFMEVFISAYMYGAFAAFYKAISSPALRAAYAAATGSPPNDNNANTMDSDTSDVPMNSPTNSDPYDSDPPSNENP